ncbi:MAG: hypothetical protein IKF82_05245 [Bacilli bacterium]|nr:hypothetical protein [Bacilli bacterium]
MKKTSYIMLGLALIVIAGCSTNNSDSKDTSNNNPSEEKKSSKNDKQNEFTFSEFLNSATKEKPIIMYSMNERDKFEKELSPDDFLIFADKKVTKFRSTELSTNKTIGELSQLSDLEIIDFLENDYLSKLKEDRISINDENRRYLADDEKNNPEGSTIIELRKEKIKDVDNIA